MPRILTVDDSRAIRNLVMKETNALGFDCDEAEDGVQGLARLEDIEYDLILLDVTMPNLDGPGMLAQMRTRGNKTPVIMLTSESKKSIVSTVLKEGVDDYILKPFKGEDLRAKISKIVRAPDGAGATPALAPKMARPEAPPPPSESGQAGRQFVDVLVVDDMENVAKKLRSMVPERVSMNHAPSAQSALNMCRDRVYRVIFVDAELPDVTVATLLQQLRTLQPHAVFYGLCLRTANDAVGEMKRVGFDGALMKPFDMDAIGELLQQYFEAQDFVVCSENVLRVNSFSGKDDRAEKYFRAVATMAETMLEKIAAACFEEAILDLSALAGVGAPDRAPRLVAQVDEKGKKIGLNLRVVGTAETRKQLNAFSETADLPFFESVAAAQG